MAFVKYHVACPSCDSSDAVSVNDDGSAKCFSCGEFFPNYDKPVDIRDMYTQKRVDMKVHFNSDSFVGVFGKLTDRNISEETAKNFGVRVVYDSEGKINKHYYPYYKGNTLVAYKIRSIANKGFKSEGDIQEAGLFGQQVCNAGGKYITITEGECDALAAYELTGSKWPVVSIKNGAQSATKDIKKNLQFFDNFENIIICFDNDKPGRDAAKSVASLFPPNKARIMNLPQGYKDANDMLIENKHKEFVDCFWQAKTVTPAGIIRTSERMTEWKDRTKKESTPYPWQGLNDKLFGIRKGELVTFTGGTGLGKSSITRELEHWFINQTDDKIGIIALEEDWRRTVDGILSIEANDKLYIEEIRSRYNEQELDGLYHHVLGTDRVFIHAHFGINSIEEIFSKLRYLIIGCDCKWIIVDHLHMLVSALSEGDERRAIDNIMTQLRSLVEETGVGLLLVSHLRRVSGNEGHENGVEVNLSHLRGSQSIAQLSDCVIALERNQMAEDKTEANTTKLRVLKSRYTGDVGIATHLLYDKDTGRLKEYTPEEPADELVDDLPF